MNIDNILSKAKIWAQQQSDIVAVFLVGSYAHGTARDDSDLDLVILTIDSARYLNSIAFMGEFGEVAKWEKENWGRVTSLRVWYRDGLEIEFGIACPDWASLPLDPGTQRVISDGTKTLFDRRNRYAWIEAIYPASKKYESATQ